MFYIILSYHHEESFGPDHNGRRRYRAVSGKYLHIAPTKEELCARLTGLGQPAHVLQRVQEFPESGILSIVQCEDSY